TEPAGVTPTEYWPELQGHSDDGSAAVFNANGKLTANASDATAGGKPIYQLYELTPGGLRLVSVLPNGQPSAGSSVAGAGETGLQEGREQTVARAVSADGSTVYWTASGRLYVRLNAD